MSDTTKPASALHLVGFENDDPRNAPPIVLNTNAECFPPLSPLLPLSRAIRDGEQPASGEEANFATQQMIMLLDYLDARFELGIIPSRDDQSAAGRDAALQSLARVIQTINRPYMEHRIGAEKSAATRAALGGTAPAAKPREYMLQKDLDATMRRVLAYALAVLNSSAC